MSLPHKSSLTLNVSILGFSALIALAQANAQSVAVSSTTSAPAFSAAAESSSLETADAALPVNPAAEPAARSAPAAGGGQQYGRKQSLMSKWTFVAGGGANAPVGNDAPYITWGGNFTVGAGLRFNRFVSGLLEYQFMDNKLPGAFIAAASDANGGGITGGDAHINAITGSPVIDLNKGKNGAYLVGGWGFYHKSTNFSAAETAFDPFFGYYSVNVTVASFTSNQWGANGGIGIYHRLGGGGRYGGTNENHTKLFAEARYTYIHTPPLTQANGLGTTELIPVTFGVRF